MNYVSDKRLTSFNDSEQIFGRMKKVHTKSTISDGYKTNMSLNTAEQSYRAKRSWSKLSNAFRTINLMKTMKTKTLQTPVNYPFLTFQRDLEFEIRNSPRRISSTIAESPRIVSP